MKINWLCILLAINHTYAFEMGHEGIAARSWVLSDGQISIGSNTQVMIEELLSVMQPELLVKIKNMSASAYAYAPNILPLPSAHNNFCIMTISADLEKEIKGCLGDNIFSEEEKLS